MPDTTVWSGPLAICQCCLLVAANGECCAEEEHDREPLSQWDGWTVVPGMAAEDHNDGCARRADSHAECDADCEDLGFSWSRCDGCGSALGGDRHAAVAFKR